MLELAFMKTGSLQSSLPPLAHHTHHEHLSLGSDVGEAGSSALLSHATRGKRGEGDTL